MSRSVGVASINQAWSGTMKTKAAMKTQRRFVNQLAWATTALLTSALWATAAALPDTVEQNFSEVGEAVARLLQSGDAAGFAKELAPSIADWRAAISTNRVAKGNNPLGPDFQKSLDQQRRKLEASAKRLLAKAAELKLDFARAQITAKPKPLRVLGSARYLDPVRRLCPERGGSGAEGQSLAPDRKDPMGAIPGRR